MAKTVDCSGCGRFMPGALNRVSVLGSRNIYLLMLGLDNAGKTCAAKSLVGESLDNVAPTIGFSKVSTKYKGFNGIQRCQEIELAFERFQVKSF